MTVDEILKACDGRLVSGDFRKRVSKISTDTRAIKQNEMFLAIKGRRFDGHRFIKEAIRKRAAGVIISGQVCKIPEDMVSIEVKDTLSALQNIAGYHRGKFTLPVIAITGSNGKTTTKEMLSSILSRKFRTLRSKASFNNEVGVPLSLLEISTRHEVCILEIGMSRKGEIAHLAGVARPDIGIITNTGSAHIGNFRSLGEIAEAKSELLEIVSGTCILNADDKHYGILKRRCRGKVISFGLKKKADFHAGSLVLMSSGSSFRLNGKLEVKLRVQGNHNVYNALAAIAASSCFNIGMRDVCSALKNFRLPAWRGEIKKCRAIKIINDTYNANPDSMRAAIELFMERKERKILVIADMLELGKEAERYHEELGRFIARSNVDILFTTGDFAGIAAQSAKESGMKEVFSYRTKRGLVKKLLSVLKPCDIILVKGSRAMGMEAVVERIEEKVH